LCKNINMKKIIAGLLPFYLKLYDDISPERRGEHEKFYSRIALELESLGITVIRSPVCRVKDEFKLSVRHFEEEGACCIITLHLAYSPSLESADILAETDLPVIILDTTPDFRFGPNQEKPRVMYNHGIHGVQDLCSLLNRKGKPFLLEAGHYAESDVLKRITAQVPAAQMASVMRGAKIGCIGKPFPGMGDFSVPLPELKDRIGVEALQIDPGEYRHHLECIEESEISQEIARDREKFDATGLPEEVHLRSVKTGLAVRKWMTAANLTGFTYNFMDITRKNGFETVPFLEASKAMASGVGYAGEGDVLTAALAGSVMSYYKRTSFTEMFCPDWKDGRVFLSHMGEINTELIPPKSPLVEMDYTFSDTGNPAFVPGRFIGGEGLLINLAPAAGGRFRLILSPVEVDDTGEDTGLTETVRGWIKPPCKLEDFLKQYSLLGGTHHLILTYSADLKIPTAFGKLMDWTVDVIE
jgi:L-arabinose isomerase